MYIYIYYTYLYIYIGQGIHYIGVIVSDKWGAEYKYDPSSREVIVDPPTASLGPKLMLEEAKSNGDKSQLLMFLQAQANMLNSASSSGNGESEQAVAEAAAGSASSSRNGEAEQAVAEAAAASHGNLKVDQIAALLDIGGGTVTDLAGAEIMSKTIEAIIGKPAEGEEKSTLGQEILRKTTRVLEQLVGSTIDLTDLADPSQVKTTVSSITSTIGTLLEALYGMAANLESSVVDAIDGNGGNEIDYANEDNR